MQIIKIKGQFTFPVFYRILFAIFLKCKWEMRFLLTAFFFSSNFPLATTLNLSTKYIFLMFSFGIFRLSIRMIYSSLTSSVRCGFFFFLLHFKEDKKHELPMRTCLHWRFFKPLCIWVSFHVFASFSTLYWY